MTINNVLCLNVGEKYHHDYVNILYNSCKRFCSLDFRFYCFTDKKRNLYSDITQIFVPSIDSVDGWWYKLYAFSHEKFYENGSRNLYFDLDVVIINSIDKFFVEDDCNFYMIKDWLWYEKEKVFNSSVVSWSWSFSKLKNIWNLFLEDKDRIIEEYPGDQEFLSYFFGENIKGYDISWCKSFKEVFVNKSDCLCEETSIIVFHGFPKPHDLLFNNFDENNLHPWIRNLWR